MMRLKLYPMLVILFISACTLRAPASNLQMPSESELQRVQMAALLIQPTPTGPAVIPAAAAPDAGDPALAEPDDAPPTPAGKWPMPTAMPDPLKFTFPTSQPEGVSLWRAPLYPVPWEPTPNDHFYFTRPIGANETNWPLARYRYGYLLYAEPHGGIDIPSPRGTPILAAGPGTVIWAGYGLYFQRNIEDDPYGIAVAIQHDFGYKGQILYTIYGHMNETYVYRGQHVETGDALGVVGETGRTSGPHLHFEVRIGDDTYFTIRNPELWISPPQGTGVLVGRVTQSNGDKAPGVRIALRSKEGKGNFDVLSYAETDVNCDEYYNENVVLGDVPAGEYMIYFDFKGEQFKHDITIQAGQANFFAYRYRGDLVLGPPPTPDASFTPPDATPTAEK